MDLTLPMSVESDSSVHARALAFLARARNPDGGWGYALGEASAVEPTAAVSLALRDDPGGAELRHDAVVWLRSAQNPDGGWGLTADDAESGWQTAWAVLALARDGLAVDRLSRGVEWLLKVSDSGVQQDDAEASATECRAYGWAWLPGQATWVVPTALTMLALASVPSTAAILACLDQAVRYVQERRCRGGGWNWGPPIMLDAHFSPRAHPTSLALLALSRVAPEAIEPEDIAALRGEMHRDPGALAQAWGLVALRSLGLDDVQASVRLAELQGPDGGWHASPYYAAVAVMAMNGHL
jgi:hypothetical protein